MLIRGEHFLNKLFLTTFVLKWFYFTIYLESCLSNKMSGRPIDTQKAHLINHIMLIILSFDLICKRIFKSLMKLKEKLH